MLGIGIKEESNNLVITWQLSRIELSLGDIEDVFFDNTYAGQEESAIRIGTPYATTDRVVIKTNSKTYILFTTNGQNILEKIQSYL
ncbi:hypothetical protein MKY98_25360 [Paenibacillus sp. FSL M8-0228]|uniref:SunI/YnzG family protein n=1 Tax=Paenibacillus TaxID=44249 RepID=UPI00083DA2C4|nr:MULTISPECIES: hypothetical protein [Paenibacillus]MBO3284995.1 hypothetical protein [Paenibacillus polymyxa]ODB53593.1 hypothetical protein A7311_04415 [Paenibacillus polymyxa]